MTTKKLTSDDFIQKSNLIHNYFYDYSLVDYKNNKTNINLICPIHGIFNQRPSEHLNGKGCKLCGNIKTSKKLKSNLGSFIAKAKLIHNDKFDYSDINYINNKTKIKIICPIHGEFEQTPNNHLNMIMIKVFI